MKKLASLCLISATLVFVAGRSHAMPADVAGSGKVLKDNVNIRSRADKNSEVITQLKKGESVEVKDRKGEWLRIEMPGQAKCYIAAKFIKDGVVTADAINVRCGPGTNYKDVGKVNKGDKVVVVSTKGEWTQIKPTAACSAWVAAELVEVSIPTPKAAAPIGTVDVIPAPTPAPPAPPAPPVPPVAPPVPSAEKPKDVQTQYVVKDGYLAVVNEVKAPGQYALMTENKQGLEYIIAYVESSQTNLSRYEGRHVRVMGNLVWKAGERLPVLVADRCVPVW